jgi:hypothetical protein
MQHTTSTEIVAQPTQRTAPGARRTMAKRIGVAAIAAALFGTVALPAAALQTASAQPAVLDGSIAEILAQSQQRVDRSPLAPDYQPHQFSRDHHQHDIDGMTAGEQPRHRRAQPNGPFNRTIVMFRYPANVTHIR